MDNQFLSLKGIQAEELVHLKNITANLSEQQISSFLMVLKEKRREPEMILILTIVGLLGFAGIQRFLVGQIGMGILYFLTGGLCLIGTILDIVNHKKIAGDYNMKMADEAILMVQ